MASINYDDERFTQVEQEKQEQLNKYDNVYNDLINKRDEFTQQQQDYVDKWQNTQNQIANDNLQHQIDLANQQKEKAEEDYQKEAKASYIDYQKEIDKYGVSRENAASNGLANSGYAESSKVDMYNTYQNRIASARSSLNDIKLEFDNAIKEAQLSNNATIAENALKALEQKLQIALEGFNYKTEQENNKLNWNYNINNTYYNRYQDVEDQINYENEQAEAIRQWNEQMAFQKQQAELAQQQWEKEYALQQQQLAMERESQARQQAYYQSLIDGNGGGNNTELNNSSSSSNSKIMGTDAGNSLYNRLNMMKKQNTLGMSSSQMKDFLAAQVNSAYKKGEINSADVNNILNKLGIK